MRCAILSRKRHLYSTKRLVEGCKNAGIDPVVINPLKCGIVVGIENNQLFYNKRKFPAVDVVIPRIGGSITGYGLTVLRQLVNLGIPSVSSPLGIEHARDKFRTLQLLAQSGIPVPKSIMVRNPKDIDRAIRKVGGVPVIVKFIRGTQGIGVIILDSDQSAKSTVEALWKMGRNILIQQYIIESRGVDIRAIVVNGSIVASYKRIAAAGEFRSNIHQGSLGERVDLSHEHQELTVNAAKALGLGVAGIDMIESVDGMKILEVNVSPGLEGVEKVTGINVAQAVIEYAAACARSNNQPGDSA